ncbi:MAG TPA: 7-cyano-7-deazaguanine synthase [Gemmataceae bacterium]|nr:7-cyano-7-deazaguanine synthase [Gemmataceae bacterium]
MNPLPSPSQRLAVLISGGLDSAILLAESLGQYRAVFPLYVRMGLAWETVELRYLRRFLEAIHRPALQPLHILDLPVGDLYGGHWSITGEDVPDEDSPDEAVFLPGRNVLLLSKGMLWCHLHDVPALALGHLGSNPFPDATPAFFATFEKITNQAVEGVVQVRRPYAGLSKTAVMHRGRGLPLEWTYSCIRPVAGKHCGRCNKCAERRRAFSDAGLADRTVYTERAELQLDS